MCRMDPTSCIRDHCCSNGQNKRKTAWHLTATLIAHVHLGDVYLTSAFTSARRVFRVFAHLRYIYRTFPIRCQIDVYEMSLRFRKYVKQTSKMLSICVLSGTLAQVYIFTIMFQCAWGQTALITRNVLQNVLRADFNEAELTCSDLRISTASHVLLPQPLRR